MKLKDQKKYAWILIAIGAILWVVFAVSATDDYSFGLLCGIAAALTVIGILRLIKINRLYKDPEKAEDYDNSINDERVKFIADKARSLTFVIAVFAQLFAGLFCQFALHNRLLNMVFCYSACAMCLIYVVIYQILSRKY